MSSGSWVSQPGGPDPRPRQRRPARQRRHDRARHPARRCLRVNGTVLIVEDEALVALTMEGVRTEAGYLVCGVPDTPDGALELARRHEPGLAVVDVRLAGGGD